MSTERARSALRASQKDWGKLREMLVRIELPSSETAKQHRRAAYSPWRHCAAALPQPAPSTPQAAAAHAAAAAAATAPATPLGQHPRLARPPSGSVSSGATPRAGHGGSLFGGGANNSSSSSSSSNATPHSGGGGRRAVSMHVARTPSSPFSMQTLREAGAWPEAEGGGGGGGGGGGQRAAQQLSRAQSEAGATAEGAGRQRAPQQLSRAQSEAGATAEGAGRQRAAQQPSRAPSAAASPLAQTPAYGALSE